MGCHRPLPYNEPLRNESREHAEASVSNPEIHLLDKVEEFAQVVKLQREIWGFQDVELLPLRLFIVASKIGGQVLGAYDAGKLVAFCLCMPGLKPGGKPYLHSQMLGVLPPYRNTGLGRKMKLKQREYALAAGVDLIEWTFDPLEIKNAFFNIERLGAIVRRYVANQYGKTTSHLHGGLPTDRLVAEWWIRTARAERGSTGKPVVSAQHENMQTRISVPADIAIIREQDPRRAREIQSLIAGEFQKHFRQGLAVVGFERSEQAGTYLLGEWESK